MVLGRGAAGTHTRSLWPDPSRGGSLGWPLDSVPEPEVLDRFADDMSGRPARKREGKDEVKVMERRFLERLKNEGRSERRE